MKRTPFVLAEALGQQLIVPHAAGFQPGAPSRENTRRRAAVRLHPIASTHELEHQIFFSWRISKVCVHRSGAGQETADIEAQEGGRQQTDRTENGKATSHTSGNLKQVCAG